MAKVYGIDLGTTYSAIATLDENGLPEIIENTPDSSQLLASAVYFPEGGGSPVVGSSAKNQAEVEPDRVVQFVKREIGKHDAQIRDFDGVKYDPITISSLILKRMKEYADEQGHDVKDVVITCPAYFGTEERNATRQAGVIAGLNVLNIVNEPTAAALNYCCREFRENRKIMVYDLGGGTFDITLFDFSVDDSGKASIDVINTGGDDRLGGIDWDARLYDYICEQYADEEGVTQDEMDSDLRQRIRSQVEETKKALSNMQRKSFTINYAGTPTRIEVEREKYEELTLDLVERSMDFVRQLLSETGITSGEIDVVLLVGSSTKAPMIKAAVEGMFPGKVRVEQPDYAVAKGAALAAAVEWNERLRERISETGSGTPGRGAGEEAGSQTFDNSFDEGSAPISEEEAIGLMINVPQVFSGESIVSDQLSRSFGPAVFNESGVYAIDNLLFMGDETPAEASQTYGTMVDNQKFVELYIFENVATDRINKSVTPSINERDEEQYTDPALKVKSLGKVVLDLPPNTPKGSPVEVLFYCSTDGLKVKARNPSTGQSVETEIASDNTMSKEELDEAVRRFASIHTSGQV
jgi:molecular chaperone DnaK (HSP70)